MALPVRYLVKHRAGLLDASTMVKIHHGKEVFVRLALGYCFGAICSQMLFGSRRNDQNLIFKNQNPEISNVQNSAHLSDLEQQL